MAYIFYSYSLFYFKLTVFYSLLSILSPELPERENFLYSAVRWSSTPEHKLGHPKLHQMIAQVFWKGNNFFLI